MGGLEYLVSGWQKHSMLGQEVGRKLRIFQRAADPVWDTDQRERTIHPYRPYPRQRISTDFPESLKWFWPQHQVSNELGIATFSVLNLS